jgi:hypothetical protein
MGILWAAEGTEWSEQSDTIQLCAILRDMVWVSNDEFLASEQARRTHVIIRKGRTVPR